MEGRIISPVPEELALIEKAQQGDREAFCGVVSLYQARIYSLAYSIAHNHADAEDIAQEVFIRLWSKIRTFRGNDSSFYTWLYRLSLNVCRNYLRRERRNPLRFEEPIVDRELIGRGNSPAREAISKETGQAIAQALDALDYKHRIVAVLHDVEGLSHREISEILGCSEGTVWSRLFYARGKLRQKLQNLFK